MRLFESIKEKFFQTKENISNKLKGLFAFFVKVDEEFLDKLEETLIVSDVSVRAASKIRESLREKCKFDNVQSPEKTIEILKEIIKGILIDENDIQKFEKNIIIVIGINGVGKTTTIGKLANFYRNSGNKVLIAAGDTFRAAASEQLEIWAERSKCEILKKSEGADPGAVVYESISKAISENFDILICDTAGRLHNKSNLMAELQKIDKIVNKNISDDYHKNVFLVLDASTGQNMVNQVEEFSKILNITGLILTKLDGTAKGGAVISVREQFKDIPIRYIGIGEKIDDLQEFDYNQFVDAILDGVNNE